MVMRTELSSASCRIISSDILFLYNVFITLHGLMMIFFLIMPLLWGGVGNLVVALSIG